MNKSNFIFFSLIFLTFNLTFSQEQKTSFPKFLTKLNIQDLRFLSDDGKVSYLQNNSGHLTMSLNYTTQVLLKGSKESQFEIFDCQKKLLISHQENYFSNLNSKVNYQYYLSEVGANKIDEIQIGLNAKFNEQCQYLFIEKNDNIFIYSLNSASISKKIPLLQNTISWFPIGEYLFFITKDKNHFNSLSYLKFAQDNFPKTLYIASKPHSKISLSSCNNQHFLWEQEENSFSTRKIISSSDWKLGEKFFFNKGRISHAAFCLNNQFFFGIYQSINENLNDYRLELYQLNDDQLSFKKIPFENSIDRLVSFGGRLLILSDEGLYSVYGNNKAGQDAL